MPIKKDQEGKRWVELDLLVPGTPEQVWEALATGPGNTAWFTETEVQPRVGGAVRFSFGEGAVSTGEVTTWQPPERFAYVERNWADGAPPVATEITITARSGNRCVVHMAHTLFTASDAWDDQLEGFEQGWPGFFEVLRVYLTHFAGQPAATFTVRAPAAADYGLGAFRALTEALGLGGANVGERRSSASGPEPWSGVVEHVHQDATQRYLLLRLDAPSAGVAFVGTCQQGDAVYLSACRYFYGSDAAARSAESHARWRDWLPQALGRS